MTVSKRWQDAYRAYCRAQDRANEKYDETIPNILAALYRAENDRLAAHKAAREAYEAVKDEEISSSWETAEPESKTSLVEIRPPF
jgi:hypothetical protein